MKKGIFFTLDSVFGLLILTTIDVAITPDIIMGSVAINEVPYLYGPVDIGVVTWID
jgi:hypothetical protein